MPKAVAAGNQCKIAKQVLKCFQISFRLWHQKQHRHEKVKRNCDSFS